MQKDIETILNESKLSRRDAMKVFGLGGAGMMMGSGVATEAKASVDAKGKKILIVGGGMSGVATASRLNRELDGAEITILEANPKSVSYQPGYTLVGSGIWTKDDVSYNTSDFMPDGVTWVKESAVEFNPDANSVKTNTGKEFKYDYLVVAAGLALDFGSLKGLESIGDVLSNDEITNKKAQSIIGKNGLTSVYFINGAVDTWTHMQEFVAAAKSGKKVKGVFVEPATPFKCGGAQKKVLDLTVSRLREASAFENAELTFITNGKKLFGVPAYSATLDEVFKKNNVKILFEHKFIGVDPVKKVILAQKHWEEKGAWDPLLEEHEMVEKTLDIEVPYDFSHIIPPQKAPKVIADSPIGSGKGWIPVKKGTLQHVKFPNVFALGDVIAVPLGKTGGSARKQYDVLCKNLVATIENKPMEGKYDGYTVCPLITEIGEIMLAEFKWDPKDDAKSVEAPSFPLDPAKPRWIYWAMKVYLLKPMTMYGMLSGRA